MMQDNNIQYRDFQKLQSLLWNDSDSKNKTAVYALLDGASDKNIVTSLKKSKSRYNCLYEGKLLYNMELSAPYLVRLEKNTEYTTKLMHNSLNTNLCIYMKALKPVTMLSILRISKRNLKILTPENKKLVFRYYDPRIIRNYLPSCTTEEANLFFGAVDEIICNSNNILEFNRFTRTNQGVLDLEKTKLTDKNILKTNYSFKTDGLYELKIRQEQLNILSNSKLPAFFKKINEYIINEFPEIALEQKDNLMTLIKHSYYQAKSYGLSTEREHYKFINYKCIFGNNFMEEYGFAEKIMKTNASPSLKLRRLKDAFMEHLNS